MQARDDLLVKGCVFFALDLAGLQNHAAIAVFRRPGGRLDNLVGCHPVTLDLPVSTPNSAIETVFGADIGTLYQSAQRHHLALQGAFLAVRRLKKRVRIRRGKNFRHFRRGNICGYAHRGESGA